MSYLGNIFIATELEQAAVAHYRKWETTYLAEVERLRSLDPQSLPVMRSFSVKNDLEKFPEEQLPALVAVSPGVADGTVSREGDGTYSANWDLGIAIVSSGYDESTTNALRAMYGAVVRAIFLQHPSVFDKGVVTEWVDESYTDIPVESGRTMSTVQLIFRVRVDAVVEAFEGVREPLADPYADYDHSVATDVAVDLNKVGG